MPSLPTYNSSENINTQPAGVERDVAAQPFKDIQNMVGTVQKITQGLSDANDVMQETKAKTHAEVALAQQEQAAQNDPNPDNAEMHIKAINDLSQTATKGIDNQEVAGRVGLEIQQSAFLSQIKIQDLFKKKQMFANDVSLDQLATTAAANKANAVSPAAGQQDEDNFMSTISKNVNTGLITPERGMQLVKQYKAGVAKTKIAQNPSTNADDYKSVTDGLDLTETNEANKMIAAHIKQVQDKNISDTLSNRVNTIKGIANKQIDWQSADKINAIAAKDPKLGEALQSVFNAQSKGQDYAPTSEENNSFQESIGNLFKSMNQKEVSDYLVGALKDKGMTSDRMAILVNAAEDRSKALPIQGVRDINPTQTSIDGGFNAIQRWNNAHGGKDPQVISDYLKEVHSGKSPVEAYNTAISTKQIKTNPARSQYQIGQLVFNQKTGMSAEVIGYDDNGAPLVRVKHGKQPNKQPDKQ